MSVVRRGKSRHQARPAETAGTKDTRERSFHAGSLASSDPHVRIPQVTRPNQPLPPRRVNDTSTSNRYEAHLSLDDLYRNIFLAGDDRGDANPRLFSPAPPPPPLSGDAGATGTPSSSARSS